MSKSTFNVGGMGSGAMQVVFNVEQEMIEIGGGDFGIGPIRQLGTKNRTLEFKVTLLGDDDVRIIRYEEGPLPDVLKDREPGFMLFFPDRKEFWLYGLSLEEFTKTVADLGLAVASGEVQPKRMVLVDE